MNLTASEREPILLFDDGTDTATLETCNKQWKKRMDALCVKNQACSLVSETAYSKKYRFPKTWVKVQMPRQLSDEQRQKLRENASAHFHREVTQ